MNIDNHLFDDETALDAQERTARSLSRLWFVVSCLMILVVLLEARGCVPPSGTELRQTQQ